MKQLTSNLCFVTLFSVLATASANATDWSGAYIGLAVGENQLINDWSAKSYTAPFGGGSLPFASDPTTTFSDRDETWSLYGGYNWQLQNNLVAGAEINVRYNDGGADHVGIPGSLLAFDPTPFPYSSLTVEAEWEAAIRARFGALITPSTLAYGTVGIAAVDLYMAGDCPDDTNVCNPGQPPKHNSDSSTETGWTAGLGIESLLTDNLSLRLDYSYTDYGSTDFVAMPMVPGGAYGISGDIETITQAVTIGAAYKF